MELNNFLANFREQINTIDKEIIYLLSRRFELAKQISKIKKEKGLSILQNDRWDELLNILYKEAEYRGVNKKLIDKIWNEIHIESIKIQK